MSYYGIPNAAAQAQAAVAQYISANQYNVANILGGGNCMGSGGTGGIGVGVYSYPISHTTSVTNNTVTIPFSQQPIYGNVSVGGVGVLPAPSGQMASITFMDVNGLSYSLDIDAAYVQLLQAISLQHQYGTGAQQRQANAYQQPKMLEGDFSEDEMSQAEQIIQEMNHGSQKQPCECEA